MTTVVVESARKVLLALASEIAGMCPAPSDPEVNLHGAINGNGDVRIDFEYWPLDPAKCHGDVWVSVNSLWKRLNSRPWYPIRGCPDERAAMRLVVDSLRSVIKFLPDHDVCKGSHDLPFSTVSWVWVDAYYASTLLKLAIAGLPE